MSAISTNNKLTLVQSRYGNGHYITTHASLEDLLYDVLTSSGAEFFEKFKAEILPEVEKTWVEETEEQAAITEQEELIRLARLTYNTAEHGSAARQTAIDFLMKNDDAFFCIDGEYYFDDSVE